MEHFGRLVILDGGALHTRAVSRAARPARELRDVQQTARLCASTVQKRRSVSAIINRGPTRADDVAVGKAGGRAGYGPARARWRAGLSRWCRDGRG
jgi:hypothetical protein